LGPEEKKREPLFVDAGPGYKWCGCAIGGSLNHVDEPRIRLQIRKREQRAGEESRPPHEAPLGRSVIHSLSPSDAPLQPFCCPNGLLSGPLPSRYYSPTSLSSSRILRERRFAASTPLSHTCTHTHTHIRTRAHPPPCRSTPSARQPSRRRAPSRFLLAPLALQLSLRSSREI
jgi:hypothetical protein